MDIIKIVVLTSLRGGAGLELDVIIILKCSKQVKIDISLIGMLVMAKCASGNYKSYRPAHFTMDLFPKTPTLPLSEVKPFIFIISAWSLLKVYEHLSTFMHNFRKKIMIQF